MPYSLSVLVAALNERDNLADTVDTVLTALRESVADSEVIVVDDGSSDGTGGIADRIADEQPSVRVIHNGRNMGLGYSYLRGVDAAQKDFFVFVPADNSWPCPSLLRIFRRIGAADVVTTYTTNPEIRPLGRRLVSSLYTRALNVLFRHRLHYYNGLTVYPLSFLKTRPVTTYGFGFASEALLRAMFRGLSVVEVAVPIEERAAGGSKAVRVKNIASVAAMLVRLYWDLRVVPLVRGRPRPAA